MKEKGQSLVEFSIGLVVILILLSGAVEVGITLFQYIQLRDAVQEGALFGSTCQDFSLIEGRARGASNSPLDLTNNDISVQVELTDDNGIAVTMEYNHKVFMPFANVFAGEYVHIQTRVVDTILTNSGCK